MRWRLHDPWYDQRISAPPRGVYRDIQTNGGRRMPTEDQRERDQMWKRIDSHGERLNDVEQGLTQMKAQADENGRNIGDLAESLRRTEAATNQVHVDLSTLIGQSRAMKRIVAWLSAILVVIQILDTLSDKPWWPL